MSKKKYFIITIDTEGDNLWAWKKGYEIKTENTLFLPRFQELCDKYSFKPVWLSNWEMMNDERYAGFARRVQDEDRGEIGMHLHAWNTPPLYDLVTSDNPGAPYLIEYPDDVMNAKIETMTKIIEEKTGVKPVTHRAGRWATDERYFDLLYAHGYRVDCSVTPHVDWSETPGETEGSKGSDYSSANETSYRVKGEKSILEVPVTIIKSHRLFSPTFKTARGILGNIYHSALGNELWLRPDGTNLEKMLYTVDKAAEDEGKDYLMFMLHSSELMPGGSPTFRTEESIEKLYKDLEVLFEKVSHVADGITLRDYEEAKRKENE